MVQAAKQIGVSDKTYFRWRMSHGGLRVDQAKGLRDLEARGAASAAHTAEARSTVAGGRLVHPAVPGAALPT